MTIRIHLTKAKMSGYYACVGIINDLEIQYSMDTYWLSTQLHTYMRMYMKVLSINYVLIILPSPNLSVYMRDQLKRDHFKQDLKYLYEGHWNVAFSNKMPARRILILSNRIPTLNGVFAIYYNMQCNACCAMDNKMWHLKNKIK